MLSSLLALPLAGRAPLAPPKAPAAPQETKLSWDGEWTLLASQSDKIPELIDAQVKDMNFAMKLLWKQRLQSACREFSSLDILVGEGFSVIMGKENPVDTPADGTESTWKRKDEKQFKASLTKDGRTMIQTITGDGYTMKYVYSMRKDGNSLALQITYTHPKLDNPFSYKLVFKRND
jgi:hypothetical protein